MARLATIVLAPLVILTLAVPGAVSAAHPPPKVVVVVGPVGTLTDSFRALGDEAAAAARAYTTNVVKVYSPNATWPAVRRALQGASIVVYLGHGNGWPSRYRSALFPPTQNGFGLNPIAGAGDDAHQYFGEATVAREVKLAKDAVVVLSHLCYASGNTEPGLPEGTASDARQRIDNFAAGFIGAGASAVIAEGHFGAAWYVRSLLGSNRSVERLWRTSPSGHGNIVAFASKRSPGFTAMMDPDSTTGGFYRSIVLRGGLSTTQLAAGATTVTAAATLGDPTLVGTGLSLGTPYLHDRPIAGATAGLWIPFRIPSRSARPKITVGVRWDPIEVADSTPSAGGTAGPAAPNPTPSPTRPPNDPAGLPTRPGEAPAIAKPPPTVDPNDPSLGEIQLVEPEQLGSLVQPARASFSGTRVKTKVDLPDRPGRYRLVITLHDAHGVAYDAATQAMVRGLLVHVTGAIDAGYLVAPAKSAIAGSSFTLPVGVANLGARAWGREASGTRRTGDMQPASHATLVARWIRLDTGAGAPAPTAPAPDVSVDLPAGLAGGTVARVVVTSVAPSAPGDYLLMLDVLDPGVGSLAAKGVAPTLVRVTVTER